MLYMSVLIYDVKLLLVHFFAHSFIQPEIVSDVTLTRCEI